MTEWIEWNYTPEKPYPETLDTRVLVKFRDGTSAGTRHNYTVEFWHGEGEDASNWKQGTNSPDDEIVAYKVDEDV